MGRMTFIGAVSALALVAAPAQARGLFGSHKAEAKPASGCWRR